MLCMLCIFLRIHFSIAFFIFGHFQTDRQTMKDTERQITEDNLWLLIYNHKNKMNTIFYKGQNQCHSTGVKIILLWPYHLLRPEVSRWGQKVTQVSVGVHFKIFLTHGQKWTQSLTIIHSRICKRRGTFFNFVTWHLDLQTKT